MGPLSILVGPLLAPVRGVVTIAELVRRQVDEELHHPASARRDLEEIDRQRAEGELSPAEEAEAQQQVLERMTARRDRR